MRDEWNATGKYYFFATCSLYLMLFLVSVIVASHTQPIFNPSQIYDYGIRIAAATSGIRQEEAMGTPESNGVGFWVSTNGLMLTCLSISKVNNVFSAWFPVNQGTFQNDDHSSVGFCGTPAQLMLYDPDTGLALFYVQGHPWLRNFHTIKNNKGEWRGFYLNNTGPYFSRVPTILTDLVHSGESIYIICPYSTGGATGVHVIPGQVTSIETVHAKITSGKFNRIRTSIPFRSEYRGCPVLDASERVVGLVMDSDSDATLIPSAYISDLKAHYNSLVWW